MVELAGKLLVVTVKSLDRFFFFMDVSQVFTSSFDQVPKYNWGVSLQEIIISDLVSETNSFLVRCLIRMLVLEPKVFA